MDLVNDLSSDLALAVFVDGNLKRKLGSRDAKSFIALVEEELERISAQAARLGAQQSAITPQTDLSHWN